MGCAIRLLCPLGHQSAKRLIQSLTITLYGGCLPTTAEQVGKCDLDEFVRWQALCAYTCCVHTIGTWLGAFIPHGIRASSASSGSLSPATISETWQAIGIIAGSLSTLYYFYSVGMLFIYLFICLFLGELPCPCVGCCIKMEHVS